MLYIGRINKQDVSINTLFTKKTPKNTIEPSSNMSEQIKCRLITVAVLVVGCMQTFSKLQTLHRAA